MEAQWLAEAIRQIIDLDLVHDTTLEACLFTVAD
jgi:hypothetical protein